MSQTTGNGLKRPSTLTDTLFRYRWVFVVPVVLPLSTLFNLFWAVRSFYHRRWKRAPKAHERRVREIQDQIRQVERRRDEGTALHGPEGLAERVHARPLVQEM